MSAREDDQSQTIADLERQLHRARAEVERLREVNTRQLAALVLFARWLAFTRRQVRTRDEHLEWAEEQIRVYRRVIARLA